MPRCSYVVSMLLKFIKIIQLKYLCRFFFVKCSLYDFTIFFLSVVCLCGPICNPVSMLPVYC